MPRFDALQELSKVLIDPGPRLRFALASKTRVREIAKTFTVCVDAA